MQKPFPNLHYAKPNKIYSNTFLPFHIPISKLITNRIWKIAIPSLENRRKKIKISRIFFINYE